MANYRKLFPFLKKNKHTIYLDTAASGLKLKDGIEAEINFLSQFGTNVDRALYDEGLKTTDLYERARQTIAEFINADLKEIIFTSGTTDGLHLLSQMLKDILNEGDEILLSQMEHNSNFLPWLKIARDKNLVLKEIPLDLQVGVSVTNLVNAITPKTKVLSISMASNVLGITPPLKEIINLCHAKNILVIGDGAQFVPHHKVDVKQLGIDFLVFSGHKLYATNGIGILYGKYDKLLKFTPPRVGGGVLSHYDNNNPIYKNPPHAFEAGTPCIAQAIALASVIKRLNSISMSYIYNYEMELTKYLISKLSEIKDIEIISKHTNSPLVSFVHKTVHSHDLAGYFANKHICIRAGFHCAERLLRMLGYHGGCLRVSVAFYNTIKEIDIFIQVLKEALAFFKGVDK